MGFAAFWQGTIEARMATDPKPARKRKPASKKARKPVPKKSWYQDVDWRGNALPWAKRGALGLLGLVAFMVVIFAILNPVRTPYMLAERLRLGAIEHDWTPMEEIAPVAARSVVAAEDANFCLHWGLDLAEIRKALDQGKQRGASTISQQTVKNVYLWQGRSWTRKVLEALLTPMIEAVWTKRRILEVYLNVAEFGEGVFGIEAAAQQYFDISAANLTATQAARLAAILPDPKNRSASNPSSFVRSQAGKIVDGAATIEADGRAACFEITARD
jgi:monofunctional biosynthetic peptidoglycan transglycosylase